jgi:hypothetical protein
MTHPNASRGPLRSSIITQGIDRATHRSILEQIRAEGFQFLLNLGQSSFLRKQESSP